MATGCPFCAVGRDEILIAQSPKKTLGENKE
jgi:hypothetical protein